MWMAVSINRLVGALIAVTGAMLILGVSSFVAKHVGKYLDGVLRARKGEAPADPDGPAGAEEVMNTETQNGTEEEDGKQPPIG